ncbi:MAG: hypothetical protein WCG27_05575 [Pseudomonadota bacterium]
MSCVQDKSMRSGRATITDFRNIGGNPATVGSCLDFINLQFVVIDNKNCQKSCPTGTVTQLGRTQVVNDLLTAYSEGTGTSLYDLEQLVAKAKGFCLPPQRPSEQVFPKGDFCSCLSGKPDIINGCENFCANKNPSQATLYVEVTLGADVASNSKLGNLYNWCNAVIGDGEDHPQCQLLVENEDGGSDPILLPVTIAPGANSFSANINSLALYTNYRLTLKEITSEAIAQSIQLRRVNYRPAGTDLVLENAPIHQYTCITRSLVGGATLTPTYINPMPLHYYYNEQGRPGPLAGGDPTLYCHDIIAHGAIDQSQYPRWEDSIVFPLWKSTDSRFFDFNRNGQLDIHDLLKQRMADEYNFLVEVEIFTPLTFPNMPNSGQQLVGYLMRPWIYLQNQKSYCPKQQQYLGQDPLITSNSQKALFTLLKEMIVKDTEAIYLGKRDPVTLFNSQGQPFVSPNDTMLVREKILQRIWYYYDQNGQKFMGNVVEANRRTMQFLWPQSPACTSLQSIQNAQGEWCLPNNGACCQPLAPISGQRAYTITYPEEATNLGALRQNIVPSDKRLGCFPIE